MHPTDALNHVKEAALGDRSQTSPVSRSITAWLPKFDNTMNRRHLSGVAHANV
jgi:hypothetical protein